MFWEKIKHGDPIFLFMQCIAYTFMTKMKCKKYYVLWHSFDWQLHMCKRDKISFFVLRRGIFGKKVIFYNKIVAYNTFNVFCSSKQLTDIQKHENIGVLLTLPYFLPDCSAKA